MKCSSQGSWRRFSVLCVVVSTCALVSQAAVGGFSMGEPCLNCEASASVDGRFALSSSLLTGEGSDPLVGGDFTLEGVLVPWDYLQHRLSGRVTSYAGNIPIPGVEVLDGPYPDTSATTGSDGTFTFTVLNGTEHSLTPTKSTDDPIARGVTTLDISLLRRHILGLGILDSPYKMLAADVNASGTITTLDISLIRRVILGLATSYPAGLWRFVPAGYVFQDQNSPFGADRFLDSGGGSIDLSGQDFIGIKLGDVNGSWTPPVAALPPPPPVSSRASLGFVRTAIGSVDEPNGTPNPNLDSVVSLGRPQDLDGQDFVVPLRIVLTGSLTSVQCTLHWDPGVFEWVGVAGTSLRGFDESNVSGYRANQGELIVSWDDPDATGSSAVDNTHRVGLRFRRLAAVPCGGVMRFVTAPTPVEVASGFVAVPVRSQDGWLQLGRTRDESTLVSPTVSGDSVHLKVPTWLGLVSLIEVSETLSPPLWRLVESIEGDGKDRSVVLRSSVEGQGYYRARFVPRGL